MTVLVAHGGSGCRTSIPRRSLAAMTLWPKLADLPLVVEGVRVRHAHPGARVRRGRTRDPARPALGRRPHRPRRGHHPLHRAQARTCRSRASGRSDLLRSPRQLDQWPNEPARVGHGAPLAQLGVRVGGARPRAGAGRPPAPRGDRTRAAPDHLRELARPRRPAVGRHDPQAPRALPAACASSSTPR